MIVVGICIGGAGAFGLPFWMNWSVKQGDWAFWGWVAFGIAAGVFFLPSLPIAGAIAKRMAAAAYWLARQQLRLGARPATFP